MGLTVREMLGAEYFKDCILVAGREGIDKQVQGLAILDAPDGFEWTQGREFVLSAGYIFKQNPNLLSEYIASDNFIKMSGMGIKMRYLNTIPENLMSACNKLNIPLIIIPNEPSWMEIMNQLNILVMNKNIRQFNIGRVTARNFSDLTYKERKINKILSKIEREMNFPAVFYDVSSDKTYLSSPRIQEYLSGIRLRDLWEPMPGFTKEVLCENLNMHRYRFHDERFSRPYSWITVPIAIGNEITAYFIVIEAEELIDYYDQFTLRIGYLLLQSLYEQLLVAQSIWDTGFERWMTDIVKGYMPDNACLEKKASDLGVDTKRNHYLLLMKQNNKNIHMSSFREDIWSYAGGKIEQIGGRMALTDENICVFLIPVNERLSFEKNLSIIKEKADEIREGLERKIDGSNIMYGFSDIAGGIDEIQRNYNRCEKALHMGRIIFPNLGFISYSDLGVFAWLEIQEDENEIMLRDLVGMLEKDERGELAETLHAYLECHMNYSLTAKKRYEHINTVRNRIADINELITCDLEDPMSRLNLEILLKLFRERAH